MPFCGACGANVPGTTAFCADCGASLATSAKPKQTQSVERVIFDQCGVLISQTRFVCGSQTFPINGVTSIGTAVDEPKRKGPLITMAIGLAVFFGWLSSGISSETVVPILFGAALFAIGLLIFIKQRPTFHVLLRSASGETKALSNKDGDLVKRIVGALNEAVVLRG